MSDPLAAPITTSYLHAMLAHLDAIHPVEGICYGRGECSSKYGMPPAAHPCDRCGKRPRVESHYGLCCECVVPFDNECHPEGTEQVYAKGYAAGYADGVAAPPSDPAAPLLQRPAAIAYRDGYSDGLAEAASLREAAHLIVRNYPNLYPGDISILRAALATPAPKEADRE